MTPRRWQMVGGWVFGYVMISIVWLEVFNLDYRNPWGWFWTMVAGIGGNLIGQWTVRQWQQAGKRS